MFQKACAIGVAVAAFGMVLLGPGRPDSLGAGLPAPAQETLSSNSLKTILRKVNQLESQAQRITVSIAHLSL